MTATDDWPHFDPDERTETILHLQARQELEEMGAPAVCDDATQGRKRDEQEK